MTAPPELIGADDPEWCAGCQQKHSKCECSVTAADQPDNGHEEGRGGFLTLLVPVEGHAVVCNTCSALVLDNLNALSAHRDAHPAVADEQRRDIVMRWLYRHTGLNEDDLGHLTDELLSLLGQGGSETPEGCTTSGCAGDPRYAAPGRGHTQGCRHPFDAQPAVPVRQHRADPDCWCQPTRHPSGAYDHHQEAPQ